MNRNHLFAPAAAALVIMWAAGPAVAQSGGDDRRPRERSARAAQSVNHDRGAGGARSRSDEAARRPEPRAEARSSAYNAPRGPSSQNRGTYSAPRGPSVQNRGYAVPQYNRGQDNARRNEGWGAGARRDDNRGDSHNDNRGGDNGHYANRGYGWNGGYNGYGGSYGYRGYNGSSWRSHIRYGLGISIFAGRPFAFHFDYGWRPSFSYYYAMRPGVAYGGISFLVDPDQTEVYIDGQLVGIARDFGGQPVPVAAGYHRIELYAQGYQPVAFDINVLPGQVIPYRGSLYAGY